MLKDEARTMTKFRSPYIVQILGVVMHPSNYALVLEYMCHGSLREYQKNNDVSWPTILGLVHDVILGMNYLHKTVGLVHRDVKIDNILVDKGPKAKISDFGLSVWHEYSKMVPRRSRVSTTSGDQGAYCTVTHIAPECLEDINRKPDNKRDVYSFGITLWEIVTKKYPYGFAKSSVIISAVTRQQRPDLKEISPECPPILKSMMKECWNGNPYKRPTFQGAEPDFFLRKQRHWNYMYYKKIPVLFTACLTIV
ncbi:receptor-interacting serine/threonine-protein kinase 1-like [Saccoglossus kowalevskii]